MFSVPFGDPLFVYGQVFRRIVVPDVQDRQLSPCTGFSAFGRVEDCHFV